MGKAKYFCPQTFTYDSDRYGKSVTVKKDYASDGATGASDIYTKSWWVHDVLCDTGKWDDGTLCTNWQASMVLSDILKSEGRNIRSKTWLVATFLFGGGKARKNGMFKLRKK